MLASNNLYASALRSVAQGGLALKAKQHPRVFEICVVRSQKLGDRTFGLKMRHRRSEAGPRIGSRRGLAEEGRREKVGNDGGTDGGAGGQQPRAATAAGGRLFFSPAF